MPVLVDGVDLETLGLVLERYDGDLAVAAARPPSVAAPGGFGERVSGAPAALAPRTLTVRGTLRAATPAALDAARDALLARCGGVEQGPAAGAVTLALGVTTPTRQWTAYLDAATTIERGAGGAAGSGSGGGMALATTAAVVLSFVALDPRAVDVTATTRALSATAADCPVGSAPSAPLATLAGPFTQRALVLTDGAGVERGRATLTVPGAGLLTGETLEVDHAAQTVTHISTVGTGSVRTPRSAWLTGGDFFALDPAYVVGSVNPKVKLDAAGSGSLTYRRSWR